MRVLQIGNGEIWRDVRQKMFAGRSRPVREIRLLLEPHMRGLAYIHFTHVANDVSRESVKPPSMAQRQRIAKVDDPIVAVLEPALKVGAFSGKHYTSLPHPIDVRRVGVDLKRYDVHLDHPLCCFSDRQCSQTMSVLHLPCVPDELRQDTHMQCH